MTAAILFVIATIFLPALTVIGLFALFRKKDGPGRRAARWYWSSDLLTQLTMFWGVMGMVISIADLATGRSKGSAMAGLTPVICLFLIWAGYAFEYKRREYKRIRNKLLDWSDEHRKIETEHSYLLPFAADAASRLAAAYKLADEWNADDGLLLKETAGMDLAHALVKHKPLPTLPPSILGSATTPEE